MRFGPVMIALASGAALAFQVGMNNTLRARVGHPMLAAWISFVIGTAALTLYLLVARPVWPDRLRFAEAPWWMFGGGLVGAVYVASSATFAKDLGAAAWLGLIVTGQVFASLALDHFGLVGFPKRPITAIRISGALILLAGVVLVLWPTTQDRVSDEPTSVELNP
jgi:transporter family-2 protein